MASRKAEKDAARQKRLEAERAAAASKQRTQRLQILGGVIVVAIVAVVVVVIVASGGSSKKAVKPGTQKASATTTTVNKLLAGLPQSGMTLGNAKAPVTVTEFGDLECPVCADFATTTEDQLISNEVRSGKVKLVYKSFETATSSSPNAGNWLPQQAGAYAAGKQNKAWNYIETYYREQGAEDSGYATESFDQGVAQQVTGLDYATWNSDRTSSTLTNQVTADGNEGTGIGVNATPSLIAVGPKSQSKVFSGVPSYGQLQSMIKSVT